MFSGGPEQQLYAIAKPDCLIFRSLFEDPIDVHWRVSSPLAVHALSELVSSDLAKETDDAVELGWAGLYSVIMDEERAAAVIALGVPSTRDLRPQLRSMGILDEAEFEVSIEGWVDSSGPIKASRLGGLSKSAGTVNMLPKHTFELCEAISEFARVEVKSPEVNRLHWGKIRRLAVRSNAVLDQFLAETIVFSPEKLQIKLVDVDVEGTTVVEVQPWFAGAPESWLSHFDGIGRVRDRYQILTPQGLIEVLVAPNVKAVLAAIKAMPGRRASGTAAERFLHNPFATLGPDADGVIDEEQFEEAREEAGIVPEMFSAQIVMTEGRIEGVGVLIQRLGQTESSSIVQKFRTPNELRAFIAKVGSRIETGAPMCEWRRHMLEFTSESADELELLKSAYKSWVAPKVLIKALDVLNLARYSDRVKGIGVSERIVSPYIQSPSGDDPWFPEPPIEAGAASIVSVPLGDGSELELVVNRKVFRALEEEVAAAVAKGKERIDIPGHPDRVPLEAAQAILENLRAQFGPADSRGEPDKESEATKKTPKARNELLLRANIDKSEFTEQRALDLKFSPTLVPKLPTCLRPETKLKEHQLKGVAWLQNLFQKSPQHCRGALLADDMGLGKTLQLLCLIFRAFQDEADLHPVLVVAPVSLLENWKDEADKFFDPRRPKMLTLYGSELSKLRAPRHAIEEELLEQGIQRFLKPDWRGDAKIVLTTYETLRDLEFSLAAEPWSMMVCDEAQKIKNPAAMVTRAAKKQNVRFRIACTGTPVENSLADLWCLFDFIQPGLLGALNEFGAQYRRPIECETDEQRERIEQLRRLIEPQILRRTKQEVAKDLPDKIVVDEPRRLQLSEYQRSLYGSALERFKLRGDESTSSPFKNHLGLLQYLRRLCVAPISSSGEFEPLGSYRKKNPKLDWLINLLQRISVKDEKCIIFCEFRDVQLLLAHYIEQAFQFRPDIINGDTSASASAEDSRQKRIKRFQLKPGFGVIILSPIAVGFGVNIQAANHVFHFSRTWNPAKEDQATDRAYRIGQTKQVFVYYPVLNASDFTTFDVKLDLLLEGRRRLSGDMLNGCGDLTPTDFSDITKVEEEIFDERINLDVCQTLSPLEFEALIAVLWKRQGFRTVQLTSRSGDGGVDVVAKTVDRGALIQCKTSGTHGAQLNWEAIKDVVTGEAKYKYSHPGVRFVKIAVTNQYFNENAKHHASLNNVELVEQNKLLELLNQHLITRGDLESVLHPSAPKRVKARNARWGAQA
jgi:hypothetical protein